MTMGWMETIRFLGLDLMVATVFAVASFKAAARAVESAWGRFSRGRAARGSIRPAGVLGGNTARFATTEVGKQAAAAIGSTKFGAVQTATVRSKILLPSAR